MRGNLVRDIAALAKMELLPWDCWGLIDEEESKIDAESLALLDHAARLALAGDDLLEDLLALYNREPRLRVPAVINSYPARGGQHRVTLPQPEPA